MEKIRGKSNKSLEKRRRRRRPRRSPAGDANNNRAKVISFDARQPSGSRSVRRVQPPDEVFDRTKPIRLIS